MWKHLWASLFGSYTFSLPKAVQDLSMMQRAAEQSSVESEPSIYAAVKTDMSKNNVANQKSLPPKHLPSATATYEVSL